VHGCQDRGLKRSDDSLGRLTSTAANSAKCAIRPVLLSAVVMGLTAAEALAAFLAAGGAATANLFLS